MNLTPPYLYFYYYDYYYIFMPGCPVRIAKLLLLI